jgi:glycosyltransferase involved in cell wall biosynthesis
MKTSKRTVCLLFRKPLRFFSIERVFQRLEPELGKEMSVVRWTAPDGRAKLPALFQNIRAAKRNKADIFHITGDIHYMVLAFPARKTLLTIHDCVFLYHSSGIKRRLLKWLFLDWPVKHCRWVTTISEATRADILRFTGCPPEKVLVIPNPLDERIRYEERVFRAEQPVILFIGTSPNKNLSRVIAALAGIPCLLDIVGKISDDQRSEMDHKKIHYRLQAGLSDEQIAEKYRNADIVLFPSTFEGFGLPIIEGQQAGRPVITSNLEPMKGVAGGGACLVDPYDIASIREGVLRIMEDETYREELVKKGFGNIRQYAPAVIAGKYISVYEKLLTS